MLRPPCTSCADIGGPCLVHFVAAAARTVVILGDEAGGDFAAKAATIVALDAVGGRRPQR